MERRNWLQHVRISRRLQLPPSRRRARARSPRARARSTASEPREVRIYANTRRRSQAWRGATCGGHTTDCGGHTTDCGRRTAACGRHTAVDGRRTAVDGRRTVVRGGSTAACDRRTATCDRRTAACGLVGARKYDQRAQRNTSTQLNEQHASTDTVGARSLAA